MSSALRFPREEKTRARSFVYTYTYRRARLGETNYVFPSAEVRPTWRRANIFVINAGSR